MKVGLPKEIKPGEFRVGLTPASVRELVSAGHDVLVESTAGGGIGFEDADYEHAGARIAACAEEVFATSELIVKVKEPQRAEIEWLSSDHVLFTYLHLAADKEQTLGLMRSGATCIAYETVTDDHGGLPLLAPMSEIAGRLSIQVGAHHLEKMQGGRGVLLGGVAGVAPAKVVVLGGGVSGFSAARMAIGLGADVTVVDRSLARLKELEELCNGRVRTLYATRTALNERLPQQTL